MLLQRIVELFTPHECLVCSRSGGIVCDNCLPKLATASAGTCVRCNRLSALGRTCKFCKNYLLISGVSVASYYDGPVKELILRLKFQRDRSATRVGAELISIRIDPLKLPFDLVTSVPVSAARYRERGYNQSELIARAVAKKLDIPYRTLLGRSSGEHQLGKDRKTRIEQVRGVFYAYGPINRNRILIIDDVVTTGATLNACAGELKSAGARNVWGAVIAKH